MWRAFLPLAFAAVTATVACAESESAQGGTAGQGGSAQGGSAQGGSAQGGSAQGGAAQGGSAQGGAGGSDCTGPCATHDLQATFGSATAPLSRAVYGLTAPANSTSGEWEIHLEAHEGGDPGCPTMSSPTPLHTLVVSGLRAPLPATPLTEADGVSASLLDFDGALLGITPVSHATAVSITPTASSLCTACVGQGQDASGYVALDIAATFAEGSITGHVYATHCESLDAP